VVQLLVAVHQLLLVLLKVLVVVQRLVPVEVELLMAVRTLDPTPHLILAGSVETWAVVQVPPPLAQHVAR